MSVNITLTSSMRSNLSSLKSLASQMSTTQTRLSTGKKVNNAIDNANSYYQARALTNRASDLDMLLDAMGQSIQTVTTAVHGLEKSAEMLENAAVIAKEAYEAEIIPEKAWFEAQVGPNGAVVTTAQELKDAINANKKTICVYGKIDYFENQTLAMKANQKLVGTEYFTGYTGNKKFSEINFSGTQDNAIKTANNTLISDLRLNADIVKTNASNSFIGCSNVTIRNIDLLFNVTGSSSSGAIQGAIVAGGAQKIKFEGMVNIDSKGTLSPAMMVLNSNVVVAEDATLNMRYNGSRYYATLLYHSNWDIYGKLNISSNMNYGIYLNDGTYSGNRLSIHSGAEVTTNSALWHIGPRQNETFYNILNIEAGAKINWKNNNSSFISEGYIVENNTNSNKYISAQTLHDSGDFSEVPCDIDWSTWQALPDIKESESAVKVAQSSEQYLTAMTAFDEMVADSGYQGVNLIKGGKLTTMFNEDRTHSYTVEGKDMSLSGLGITTREWQTKGDIAQSIKEIQNAMSSIRDEVTRLGNHLSIIETRMNFTDGLVDVLQTGADDLVLADMNEESANYLALQTRNNLAVNALALAAQSNNAVLKLF